MTQRLDVIVWILLAALLFFAPLANAPALRHLLAFGLILLLPAFVFRRRISLGTLLPFLPWVLMAFLSATWSVAPRKTLADALWSALAPTVCFLMAAHVRIPRVTNARLLPAWRLAPQMGFFLAVIAMSVAGAVSHLGLDVTLPGWLHATYPGRGVASTIAVAAIVTAVWLVASSFGMQSRSRLVESMGLVLIIVSIVLGSLGDNRMFWLACIAAMATVMLLSMKRMTAAGWMMIVVAMAIVATGIFYAFVVAKHGLVGLKDYRTIMLNTFVGDPRWVIWAEWLKLVAEQPFLGQGYGFRSLAMVGAMYIPKDIPGFDPSGSTHAHNVFLNVVAQTGLVGLVSYLAMLAALFKAGWQGLRKNPAARIASIAMLALLAGAIAKSLTDDFLFDPGGIVIWTLLGLFVREAGTFAKHETITDERIRTA